MPGQAMPCLHQTCWGPVPVEQTLEPRFPWESKRAVQILHHVVELHEGLRRLATNFLQKGGRRVHGLCLQDRHSSGGTWTEAEYK